MQYIWKVICKHVRSMISIHIRGDLQERQADVCNTCDIQEGQVDDFNVCDLQKRQVDVHIRSETQQT
mgnify:CR=1 FL=1